MIIARAPFRISFAGGGSDLADFYRRNGEGAVISTSIAQYMYVMIHPYFHDKIRIKYSRTEDVNDIEEIQHPIVRECLKMVGVERGVEIASISDVPAGTGLGSSSTFTVCLLHALFAYQGIFVTKEELARRAAAIEIDVLKEPIGKQDQYAASFGGFNTIHFFPDETVRVEPVICTKEVKDVLEQNLLMFYVGSERSASRILTEQKKNMSSSAKYAGVQELVELVEVLREGLHRGQPDQVGHVLREGWRIKKELAEGISNPVFDAYYEQALRAGALGGKLLGAGGGGFFLFYCEKPYQERLRNALGLRELEFRFDQEGSKIVYYEDVPSRRTVPAKRELEYLVKRS